jgi:enoyl-CoA hydratase/carnithine racemase
MPTFWTITMHAAVAIVTYRRPPENTLSFLALGELDEKLVALEFDTKVSVVVLTGGIPGFFVAHADLEDVGRMARREPPQGDPQIYQRVLGRLEAMPQPVVAAINGQAWGGGCELALACSLRVVAQAGHFCQLEVSKGAIPGAGGTQRLPRLIGLSRALAMILSARVVRAAEAYELGLADAVLPDDDFVSHVLAWVGPIASQPRHALIAAKAAVMQGLHLSFQQALDNEQALFLRAVTAEEFIEERR